jgi:tRNA (guanine37-N1)-methyltransferase
MHVDVLTLFPPMIEGPLSCSIMGRARAEGRFSLGVHQVRDFGLGKYKMVDDTPYGGGTGMVMRVDVLDRAIASLRRPRTRVILFEPSGARFDQPTARRLATEEHLVLLCGHYEGVDARVRECLVDETLSIGDYVLTGGEYAALVVIDAVVRLLPGVLGNPASALVESFSTPTLEAPQYTRPRTWEGHTVPDILVSGHHARVEAWRRRMGDELTRRVRPDLDREPPTR